MMFRSIHLLALFSLLGVPIVSSGAPAVKIPSDTFDFGKVIQNATTTHSFWVKSTGDDTLRILEVVPGCGCTQMPLMDSILGPGDSTRLDIIFSTKSFVGTVAKHPYLRINTPAERVGVTILSEILTDAESVMPIVIRPPRLDVSQFTKTPRRRAIFQLVNKSGQALTVRMTDTSFKSFTVEMPSQIGPSGAAQGAVIVKTDKIPTAFKESFTFEVKSGSTSDSYTLPIERLYRIKDTATVGRR